MLQPHAVGLQKQPPQQWLPLQRGLLLLPPPHPPLLRGRRREPAQRQPPPPPQPLPPILAAAQTWQTGPLATGPSPS